MNDFYKQVGFCVLLCFTVVAATASISIIGAATPVTTPPADLGGQEIEQFQSSSPTTDQNTTGANATVTLKNQTIAGENITISSATLPEGGYIALHDSSYLNELAPKNTSVIAVSKYLPAGHYENLTIPVHQSPPAGLMNKSQLNHTQEIVAVLYHETSGNHRYEFVLSFGAKDIPYHNQTASVMDVGMVAVEGTRGAPGYEPQTASVIFHDQTLQNNTLIVAQARLPRGGFLVAYNESYQRTGNAVASAVGLSRYLPPGTYTNITVRVLPGTLNKTQTVTIQPALDTNNNQQYDFVKTNGFQDASYRNSNGTGAVSTEALVRVPQSTPVTQTPTPTPTATPTPGESSATTTSPTPTGDNQSEELFGMDILSLVAIVIVVIVILVIGGIVIRRGG